ncbi:MAG TPA: response regulator transcription factor [Dehalococcoidia bacterium]|jgi:DNA-binding NarL/FixJ family response regulator|nr:response regulator transcription factor [Dehalococcoidia bacterium]
MSKIKVLVVDDHAMFREGIRSLLDSYEDVEIVGEAAEGREAIEKMRQLGPHVVLMDIAMPVMGGLEATRRIRRENPNARVLVLTQYEDSEYILPMLRAGAWGYISKTATASELVSAIRTLHKGESFLYPSAATALIEEYLTRVGGEKNEYERLTDREREILQLVAEGHTNRDIAERLSISVKTVLRYRTNIMEKLGFHNRTDLIKYAISKGLIEMPCKMEKD